MQGRTINQRAKPYAQIKNMFNVFDKCVRRNSFYL